MLLSNERKKQLLDDALTDKSFFVWLAMTSWPVPDWLKIFIREASRNTYTRSDAWLDHLPSTPSSVLKYTQEMLDDAAQMFLMRVRRMAQHQDIATLYHQSQVTQ